MPLRQPARDDALGPQLPVEAALAGAPEREADLFRVPRVIAHDKEG